MSKELRRKLQQARDKLGHSQKDFSEYIGVNKRTLQDWEQDRATPRGFALSTLNRALDAILASK